MPMHDQFYKADEISNNDVINAWDNASEEFAGFYIEGAEFYHTHIIIPCMIKRDFE